MKYENPYLQLHLLVYPEYLKETDAGTYDPIKDLFCSNEYILSHPFENFEDIGKELQRMSRAGETERKRVPMLKGLKQWARSVRTR